MRFLPPSIKLEGLEVFLNRTMQKHNMFDYSVFCRLYDAKVNPSNLARAFRVDRKTILRWIKVHKEEQKIEQKYDIMKVVRPEPR